MHVTDTHRVHPIRVTHGTTAGYARGCRCDGCRTAYRAYHNAYRQRPGGVQYRRDEGLRGRYGMSLRQLRERVADQGGRCAICPREINADDNGRGIATHVDHDHATGRKPKRGVARVRGVLCSHCNQGLGKFADDPARLETAARYVRDGGIRFEPGLAGGLV